MLVPGTLLDGRYEIRAPLGSGGMGQVYRARRSLLGDEVAVKVLQTAFDAPLEARQRFLREARAAAQLRHPNIVSILDFNVDPVGQAYLVMELLSGPSLRNELELSGPMSPEATLAILAPVAAAVQLAHDRGITHRDLKPANILSHRFATGERVYKVIDFGLASVRDSEELRLTGSNTFLGTLGYAAPEQLHGDDTGPGADVYALGVMAYEMLTGKQPFDTGDRLTVITQTLTSRPVPLTQHLPGLTAINDVIMRALTKEPSTRWPSVTAFVRALQTAAGVEMVRPIASQEDNLLARYELGESLGRGRLGSVIFRGTHRALGIPLAVRILRREGQQNWDALQARFLIEARTLQVPHPNLLHVRDYGDDERHVFIVTDYIDGPSLREELLRNGALPWRRVQTLLSQILDATGALNAHGGFIVGVNPDMIRLTVEHGQDKLLMSTAGIGSVQDVLATMREQELRGEEASERELPYVAPEVLLGRAPWPSADVFTAGVLAYEMLTGTLPYRAPNLLTLLGQMLQTHPPAPHTLQPDVPEQVSAAILRALSADVTPRFASAAEFLAALPERR